jgi:hypothetical protein
VWPVSERRVQGLAEVMIVACLVVDDATSRGIRVYGIPG